MMGAININIEGHPTTYFSKSGKINLNQLNNYEEQQYNGFRTLKFCKKVFPKVLQLEGDFRKFVDKVF